MDDIAFPIVIKLDERYRASVELDGSVIISDDVAHGYICTIPLPCMWQLQHAEHIVAERALETPRKIAEGISDGTAT